MKSSISRVGDSVEHELLDKLKSRISDGRRVRTDLPGGGVIHVERALPFLCVHRKAPRKPDEGVSRLIVGEPCYLIGSAARRYSKFLKGLIRHIVTTQTNQFGAFLLMEVWPAEVPNEELELNHLPRPVFRILASAQRPPTVSLEALTKSLKAIRILKQKARVTVESSSRRRPSGLSPLLASTEARRLNCFVLGIEVLPSYLDPTSGEVYPVFLRKLRAGVSRALKQAVFAFSHEQTNYRPGHYHALGRRALVKSVWDIDRKLAAINDQLDFLLIVTPVNIARAWKQFKQQKQQKEPRLYYRPRPIEAAILKRKLFEIPLERVEDPSIAQLLREKRTELDRQLSMVEDRGTPNFLYGSLQLFGGVSRELLELAQEVLEKLPAGSHENKGRDYLGAEEFGELAEAEIAHYRNLDQNVSARVQIRDDSVGLMVSRGDLLIGREARIADSRAEALLQHEIGTHMLTYFNGRAQPFRQLYCGLAGYEELQEGLAVLSEYLVGGLSRPRLRLLAGRVVATECMLKGATFIDTFRELNKRFRFSQRTAFLIAVRIYRGGGFTKDAVYLRGLVSLLDYLKRGGDLSPLFLGKIAVKHVPLIKELQWRKILKPAPLTPRYLDTDLAQKRLSKVRKGLSVLDLTKGE